jgi:hypothetical protein
MYEACESIEIIIAIVLFGIVGVGDGGEVLDMAFCSRFIGLLF